MSFPRYSYGPKILRTERISGARPTTPGATACRRSRSRRSPRRSGPRWSGIDLREEITDVDVKVLRQALLDHLVLFFRDRAGHRRRADRVRTAVRAHARVAAADRPPGRARDRRAQPGVSTRRGRRRVAQRQHVPRRAADGVHPPARCNSPRSAATRASPACTRRTRVSPRDARFRRRPAAVHDITNPLKKAIRDGHSTLDLGAMQDKCPPVEHNVVVTHPETGRKALFVNRNSTTHIVGLTEREQEVLLPFLFDHVRSPEYQCRFHWEEGSIAFWDNRARAALRGGRLPRAAHHAPRHDRGTGRPLIIDYEARYLSEPGAVGLFTRLTAPSGCSSTRSSTAASTRSDSCSSTTRCFACSSSSDRRIACLPPSWPRSWCGRSGGVTQILDRLERAGLVARAPDPDDRRKVVVELTGAGLHTADAANATYSASGSNSSKASRATRSTGSTAVSRPPGGARHAPQSDPQPRASVVRGSR